MANRSSNSNSMKYEVMIGCPPNWAYTSEKTQHNQILIKGSDDAHGSAKVSNVAT